MAKLGDETEKYVEESSPFLLEKIGDFTALEESGHLTLAQCALIVPSQLWTKEQRNPEEMADHYIKLICSDIANGNLDPKHPITRIPYSEYLGMMSDGLFGEDGDEMPLATFDWLVSLDDAERWFHDKGIPVNLDGLRAEPEDASGSDKSIRSNKKKWDKGQLKSLREDSLIPGQTHQALAEKHGVTRQRIGALLKQAKEDFSRKIRNSYQPSTGVRGIKDGKKF
ncbi:MAG: hypothetical protein H0X43_04740 [Nitrosospira sp.]|nr:hypothetical protein [Nitrosospira sp.]